jgi:hypothetical protein
LTTTSRAFFERRFEAVEVELAIAAALPSNVSDQVYVPAVSSIVRK